MAFVLPTFNLTVDIFNAAAPPPIGLPRLTVQAQLRAPQANGTGVVFSVGAVSSSTLLLPPGTDIRDAYCVPINSADWVEAPQGSGRLYRVIWVDDIARGFANEHRFAILFKTQGQPWPTPIP